MRIGPSILPQRKITQNQPQNAPNFGVRLGHFDEEFLSTIGIAQKGINTIYSHANLILPNDGHTISGVKFGDFFRLLIKRTSRDNADDVVSATESNIPLSQISLEKILIETDKIASLHSLKRRTRIQKTIEFEKLTEKMGINHTLNISPMATPDEIADVPMDKVKHIFELVEPYKEHIKIETQIRKNKQGLIITDKNIKNYNPRETLSISMPDRGNAMIIDLHENLNPTKLIEYLETNYPITRKLPLAKELLELAPY